MKTTMKKLMSVLLAFTLAFSLALSVCAEKISPRATGQISVSPFITSSSYGVTVSVSGLSVKKIDVSLTLDEKGLIFYGQVNTASGSSAVNPYTCSGSYTVKSGKTYRMTYTVTVTYTNGASDTLSDEYIVTV